MKEARPVDASRASAKPLQIGDWVRIVGTAGCAWKIVGTDETWNDPEVWYALSRYDGDLRNLPGRLLQRVEPPTGA